MPRPFQKARFNLAALIACSLLILLFSCMAWFASLTKCATIDEPAHLISALSITHLRDFRLDGENPPLWKLLAAVGEGNVPLAISTQSPEWKSLLSDTKFEGRIATTALYQTPGLDADTVLHRARLRMLAIGACLAVVTAWWGWQIAGPAAGVFACLMFCLDPNFLGHSPLVKNDVALALTFVCLTAAAWLVGLRLTPLRWLLMSIALGASILVKFSGILAISILLALLLIRALLPNDWPTYNGLPKNRAARTGAALVAFASSLVVVWIMVWAFYGFRFTTSEDPAARIDFPALIKMSARHDLISRNPSLQFADAQTMNALIEEWNAPIYIRALARMDRAKLLPEQFLGGLIDVYGWTRGRKTFLLGKTSLTGWWYYFPVAMATKTPIAILIACATVAIWALLRRGRMKPSSLWTVLAIGVAPILYLAFAMASNVNVGIRHVFAVYPFTYIALGVFASRAWNSHARAARLAILLLMAGLFVETASAYPDFISFFNAAAGGQRGGATLFRDTNIDWGQDLPALADWQRGHPDRQLFLIYWGSADPRYYGIRYVNLPESIAPNDQLQPAPLRPAYAVSVNALANPGVAAELNQQMPLSIEKDPQLLHGSLYIFQ
jgi:hypothetical protein